MTETIKDDVSLLNDDDASCRLSLFLHRLSRVVFDHEDESTALGSSQKERFILIRFSSF